MSRVGDRAGRGRAGGLAGAEHAGVGCAKAGRVGVVVVQEVARGEGAWKQVASRQDEWGTGAQGVARVVSTPGSFLLHSRPELVAAELMVGQPEVIGNTPVVGLAGGGQIGVDRAWRRRAGGAEVVALAAAIYVAKIETVAVVLDLA